MKRRSRFSIAGLAVALVAGLVAVAVYRLSGIAETRAMKLEMVRAARLGLSTDQKAVWGPDPKPEQNAAILYTKLTEHRAAIRRSSVPLVRRGVPKTAADWTAYRISLAPVKDDLALFETASRLPDCRFHRSGGFDARFPELETIRYLGQITDQIAKMKSASGDPLGALRTLATLSRVATHIGKEPVTIAQLSAAHLQLTFLAGVANVVAAHGRDAKVRTQSRRLLSALGPLPSIRKAMRGEWVSQQSLLRDLESGKVDPVSFFSTDDGEAPSQDDQELVRILRKPVLRRRQTLVAVRGFIDAYANVPSDPAKVVEAKTALDASDRSLASRGFEAKLAQMLDPVYSGTADEAGRVLAQKRTLLAVLAALDAPTPSKSLPLKGANRIDPFTGAPLRYTVTPSQIRVWSVGPDRVDDGGLLKRTGSHEDVTAVWSSAGR